MADKPNYTVYASADTTGTDFRCLSKAHDFAVKQKNAVIWENSYDWVACRVVNMEAHFHCNGDEFCSYCCDEFYDCPEAGIPAQGTLVSDRPKIGNEN